MFHPGLHIALLVTGASVLLGCQTMSAAPTPASMPATTPKPSWSRAVSEKAASGSEWRIKLVMPTHNITTEGQERWLLRYSVDQQAPKEAYIEADGNSTLKLKLPLPSGSGHQVTILQLVSQDYLFLSPKESLGVLTNVPVSAGDVLDVSVPITFNQPQ